jgi:alkylation response protein AidB-like acyl-CoA dehydrogenase
MDLAPSEEQRAVQQEARRFLAAQITRERRLAWDAAPEGWDAEFWQAVGGLGWLGFGLPAEYGATARRSSTSDSWSRRSGARRRRSASSRRSREVLPSRRSARRAEAEWLPALGRGEKLVALAIAEERATENPAAFVTAVRGRGTRAPPDGREALRPPGRQRGRIPRRRA